MDPYFGKESGWFWEMLQFLAVSISLAFIGYQLKVQVTSNMLMALFEFSKKWRSRRLLNARKAVCESYLKNKTAGDQWKTVANFFEELGLLVKKNVIDSDVIWEEYSFEIEHYWPILQPKINSLRRDQGLDDTYFDSFEELYRSIDKVCQKKKRPAVGRGESACTEFCDGEIKAITAEIENLLP